MSKLYKYIMSTPRLVTLLHKEQSYDLVAVRTRHRS